MLPKLYPHRGVALLLQHVGEEGVKGKEERLPESFRARPHQSGTRRGKRVGGRFTVWGKDKYKPCSSGSCATGICGP